MANLIVLTGLRRGQVYPVGEEPLVIGRGTGARVRLPDFLLSSEHARVRRQDDGWLLEDRASTNGTYCNGRQVTSEVRVDPGDVIHLGSTELLFTNRDRLDDDAPTGIHEVLAPESSDGDADVRLIADTDAELVLAPTVPVGFTSVLPVVRSAGRILSEARDLPALFARIAEHFGRSVGGREVAILKDSPDGPRVAWRGAVGPASITVLEPDAASIRMDLVQRALAGRAAVLGRGADGAMAYSASLPASGGVIGAVYVLGVRGDLARKDLRPLFLVANLAGVHWRSHELLAEVNDRNAKLSAANAELEEARARLLRWNDELQAAVAVRTDELAGSERRYRELFEQSRDGNVTTDAAGRIASTNRVAAEVLDAGGDVIGRPLAELLGEPLAGRVARSGADMVDGELPGGRAIEVRARPLDGGGAHLVLRDVSMRRRAEERLRLLGRIVEAVREGVVSTTLDGVVTSWNPGAEALYGHAAADVVGRALPTLPDDGGPEFERVLQAVGAGQRLQLRSTRLRRDESLVPVEATFAPVPDAAGGIVGLVELSRDLTAQLATEEQLRWRSHMASFGELAAGLAHELGNPLANLRSGVEFLLARPREPEVAQESLELLGSEIDRLQRLVQQVLDLARWAPPTLGPVDVGALLDFVAAAVAARAADAKVQVARPSRAPGSAPVVVLGDVDQLKQALLNLAGNAIEAMPAGGALELAALEEGELAGFSVADTGVGIAPEHRPRIFDMFFSRRRGGGGSGIGLAIVKRVVDLHRGQVRVESVVDVGTTFSVLIPRAGAGP